MTFTKEFLSQIKITPLTDTLQLEDISDQIYFSSDYSNYISNSRMSYINPAQDGSPKKYFEEWGKTSKFTSSLAFGSAVHQLVLQPDEFFLCEDVDAPTAKVGLMADWLYGQTTDGSIPDNDAIRRAAGVMDYYKGLPTENQITKVKDALKPYFKSRFKFEQNSTDTRKPIYLDEKSRDRLSEVLNSLKDNKDIQKLLHPTDLLGNELPSENEKTILLDILVTFPDNKEVVLKLKAKLDNYTVDKMSNIITINDVKTTGKMCKDFNDAIKNFHYYREIAFYSWLLNLCSKKFFDIEKPVCKGNFLVVETIPSYMSTVSSMNSNLFAAGIKEFSTLIKMIAYYTVYGYDEC